VHEISEHIEHAGHAGHGPGQGAGLTRVIGMTVAVLGVLMALCSAQVGEARTELIATMESKNHYKSMDKEKVDMEADKKLIEDVKKDIKLLTTGS
jgi:hypothetical protein